MKQPIKYLSLLLVAEGLRLQSFAQEKVAVNGKDVGTWFSNNWIWVTGVVILLVLILLFSGGSRRKTTTVVKDGSGDVKKVTTSEIVD